MDTKYCNNCATTKHVSEFRKAARFKDGLQTQCKSCMDATSESWRQRNLDKRREQQTTLRVNLQVRYQAWKAQQKCAVCIESDPICLELHHLDPSTKDDAVSDMVGQCLSWDKIMLEVDKCVVLCSNCHRKLHGGRFTL